MIILSKLAEQQKNQRESKIKNRISKKIHDVKLAEIVYAITKKVSEVKESTPIFVEIFKENSTPQLAIENTQNVFSIENEQFYPGIIYGTSLKKSIIDYEKTKTIL